MSNQVKPQQPPQTDGISELTDSDLEAVSGGNIFGNIWRGAKLSYKAGGILPAMKQRKPVRVP